MQPAPIAGKMTFEDIVEIRAKTELLSRFFSARLEGYLATLYPLLAPKRIFGKYAGARESATWDEDNWKSLAESFRAVCTAPFDLRVDLTEVAVASMDSGIAIYPWEETYAAGGRAFTMLSPVRWAVTYRSEYSLSQLRADVQKGNTGARQTAVRAFLVNAVGFQIAVNSNPGVRTILQNLRFRVTSETVPGLGKLAMVTIAAPVETFRPPDSLIASAMRVSGVSTFHDLIEINSIGRMEDPLKQEAQQALAREESASAE